MRVPLFLTTLLLAAAPVFAGFPPEGRLTVSAYKARQGDVLVVGVRSPRGVHRVEGQLLDVPQKDGKKLVEGPSLRLLSFFPTATGDYESLLGFDLADKPGFHEVRVYLMARTGETTLLRKAVEVQAGNFSVDRLTVQEKMVDFDEEATARIEQDRRRMDEALSQHTPRAFGEFFGLPVAGQVTSSFGRRRILNGKSKAPHSGADIKAPVGAVVKSPTFGTVVLAEEQLLPGNVVVVDHGLGVFTGYFHLKEIRVQPGQSLEPGDLLGFVGMTGRVTGPHLHWMARVGPARVNPMSLHRLEISAGSQELASGATN